MFDLSNAIENYLNYCQFQKQLNTKTLKAYRIDLKQLKTFLGCQDMKIDKNTIANYISFLHTHFKPKTAKRKIASIKAFFNFLEYEEIFPENPFNKLKFQFREPFTLPRTISSDNIEKLFAQLYQLRSQKLSEKEIAYIIRDIATLELLFATGIRISELCSIKKRDLNLDEGLVLIHGKGSKERIMHIPNKQVLLALRNYYHTYLYSTNANYFFVNRSGNRLSEQSVRFMIRKYASMAGISEKITPHMFRHTFATMLLEEDVDIRYIQKILGHSSIVTTQIYTHVSSSKQREILDMKNPRNKIRI